MGFGDQKPRDSLESGPWRAGYSALPFSDAKGLRIFRDISQLRVQVTKRALFALGFFLLAFCEAEIRAQSTSRAEISDRRTDPAPPAKFSVHLWRLDGRALTPEFARALRRSGVTGVNVAGSSAAAPVRRLGLDFYVDHLAGKGPLFLDEEAWTASVEDWRRRKQRDGASRPDCLADPKVIARAEKRIDEILAKTAAERPRALSLDDEVSMGRRNIPVDYCFAPATLNRFRARMKSKYEKIEILNRHWGTRFESFASLRPASTDAIRKRELGQSPTRWNLAPWSEFRAFHDRDLAEVMTQLAKRARKQAPGIPVGFTGGEAPSPFSGIDWYEVSRELDFFEPYDRAGSRELVRSFASPQSLVFRTVFLDQTSPELFAERLWTGFLRGDRGLILWSSRSWLEAAPSLKLRSESRALASILRELDKPAAKAYMRAEPIRPKIAILESPASNRLHWMIDSRGDGGRWWRRYGSFQSTRGSQNRTREAWQKLLEDLGFDYRHISPEELVATNSTVGRGRRKLSDFDALILPRSAALSDAAIASIRRFAAEKFVIADSATVCFDETLRARSERSRAESKALRTRNEAQQAEDQEARNSARPLLADSSLRPRAPLDDLFGLTPDHATTNRLIDTQTLQVSAKAYGMRIADPGLKVLRGTQRSYSGPKGQIAFALRRHEAGGRSLYLNLRVRDYLEARRTLGGSQMRTALRREFRNAGLRPAVRVETDEADFFPWRVFRARATNSETELIAIVPNRELTTTQQKLESLGTDPIPLTLRFDRLRQRIHDPSVASEESGRRSRRHRILWSQKGLNLIRVK